MKRILLPERTPGLRYYRANLHCHSTLSDGEKTPEQLKEFYQENGYSVLAITDHEVYVPHNDLTDQDFLMLNGTELSIIGDGPNYIYRKDHHICLLAKERDNKTDIRCHSAGYVMSGVPGRGGNVCCTRYFSGGCVNELIRCSKEAGFYVTYNHPGWSRERYEDYIHYEGMDAFEVFNYGGYVFGSDRVEERAYDDLLSGGKQLYCIAADDNHNHIEDYGPYCDSFGGYVMIAAEKLDYDAVIRSLQNGLFYAGCGSCHEKAPDILSLEYEDGRIRIATTPVKKIVLTTHFREYTAANAAYGTCIENAEFDIRTDEKWFRLTAIDEYGHKALTNAYYPRDWKDEK